MVFSVDDLSRVTDNFSKERLIGKGGFGKVYRGKLRHADVAVKVLNTVGFLKNEGYQYHHVFLIAWCSVNYEIRIRMSFKN